MALTKAKVSFLEGVDGSALTGAMPAVDGSSLTGISGMTKVTSDPALNTNPSTGVGTTWVNKSSGEMFVCTDATAGENVWVNIGGGEDNVGKVFGGHGLGTVAGYTAAGYTAGGTTFHKDTVDKFSIPNPSGTATDHANLTNGQAAPTGCCTATNGYSIGGLVKGYAPSIPNTDYWTKIQKYNFAAANTVSQPGDLIIGTFGAAGISSATDGYVAGGVDSTAPTSRIERFRFNSETSVVTGGNLVVARRISNCGHSSETHGYASTGESPTADHIDKFSFASESNATDQGNLTVARYSSAGISSDTHGYVAGGNGPLTNRIDRFAFASAGNATDVGDLSEAKASASGISGSAKGYVSGAYQATSSGPGQGRIDEFAHASSVNATNVATLFDPRGYSTGTQY